MRKLVWFTVGFAAACLATAIWYGSWIVLALIAALVVTAVLAVMKKKYEICTCPLLIILGCAVGLLWFGLYDRMFVLVPRIADGETLHVSMVATDYGTETDYGSAFEGTVVLNERSYRVKAYLHTKDAVSPGDMVSGTFRFRLTASGGLEDPTSHRTEGIFLLAYSVGKAEIQKAEQISWKYYPAIWRQKLLRGIENVFSGKAGAFASALLLGERGGITYEMNSAFKISGISHVIAVSGLHVSILFGLVYTLLAKRRVLSCLLGIPVLFLFAAVVGFTPSITRACIMQSLMLLGMLTDREYDGPTALAFAVLSMLVVNPLTILSVSFQLSAGCMVGIFLFSERISNYLIRIGERRISQNHKRLRKMWKHLAASVSVSLSATVVTMPLVAYYFGCISVFGVLTNLLTLWIISFIFYGVLACLLVSLISVSVAKALSICVGVAIAFVLKVADGISQLPMSALYTVSPYAVIWLVGIYIILGIFLLQHRKKPALLVICTVFTFLLVQVFSWLEPVKDDFRVTMLDVGQGQSILLQSDGKTFLVDCGGDDAQTAADTAAAALLSQGISRLDGVIVTHYDADHAGGIGYLLSRIQTDRLILPYVPQEQQEADALANAADGAVDYIYQDVKYCFDDTEMTVFAPISGQSGNESSICVLFRNEKYGILITGDRSALGEMVLLQQHDLPKVDLLVVGHHGSAGSTTAELLEVLSPKIALISVGAENRYGHPSWQVLERLTDAGCEILRTDLLGTITFKG